MVLIGAKVSSKTLTTSDFSSYSFLSEYNRPINTSHVNKLKESFEEFGSINASVIVVETRSVTGKWGQYFADGQHTVTALNQLNANLQPGQEPYTANVTITRLKNDNLQDLVRYISALNNNSKKWTAKNYVGTFANNGIYEYKHFQNALDADKSIRISDLQLIYLRGGNTQQYYTYRTGKMRFPDEKLSDKVLKEFSKISTLITDGKIRRNVIALLHANKPENFSQIVDQIRFDKQPWSTVEMEFQQQIAKRLNIEGLVIPFFSISGSRNDLIGPDFNSKAIKKAAKKAANTVTKATTAPVVVQKSVNKAPAVAATVKGKRGRKPGFSPKAKLAVVETPTVTTKSTRGRKPGSKNAPKK